MEKKIVSPFEFAIMQAAGVPTDDVRPETITEKEKRLKEKFNAFSKRVKVVGKR